MVNGKLVKLENRDPKIKKVKYPVTVGTAEEKKTEPEKKPEPKKKPVSTVTNNNRGGGGGGGDRTPDRTPPRSDRTPTPPRRKPTGQGSQGFRMKADLGKLLKDKPTTTEKTKPKSRLEKALSWASDKKNKDAWKKKWNL